MCQILIHSPGADPITRAIFHELDRKNPDGIGMAYVNSDGVLVTWRTLARNRKEVNEAHMRYRNACEAGHLVIVHWRYTTHGDTTLTNTHPFAMPGGSVLFHNGMLDIEPARQDKSDTRTLALDCVRAGIDPHHPDPRTRDSARRLLTALSIGSRLVVLSPAGDVWKCGAWVNDPENGRAWANHGVSVAPLPKFTSPRGSYSWTRAGLTTAAPSALLAPIRTPLTWWTDEHSGKTETYCDDCANWFRHSPDMRPATTGEIASASGDDTECVGCIEWEAIQPKRAASVPG